MQSSQLLLPALVEVHLTARTSWAGCAANASLVLLQGTPQKDVVIKPDAPSTLLSEKHADYIASYGTKKDDYVGISFASAQLWFY